LLQQGFVALAADADLPEAEVHRLVFKLKNANMLPIVILAEADGRFLDGFSGLSDPARVKALLEKHLNPPPAPA
jgi:thioredoxin-like negative regulator of GroEL